jgi:probable HAF family extracellular repeat protein
MSSPMSKPSFRLLPPCALLLALGGWGCASDDSPTAPTITPNAVTAAVAATYTVKDLGTLGGSISGATAINNAGVVVGWSATPGNVKTHPFVWRNGAMRDLGTLAGGTGEALAINNDGVIVGWSTIASGNNRAVRWMNGGKKILGTLGGKNSVATAINDFGVIVGFSETASGNTHAFIWQNGVMKDLGTLGGETAVAHGINRAGAVVGWSRTASGEAHAFRWQNGVFKDLGTGGTQSSEAFAINTKGQIAGALGAPRDAQGEENDISTPFLFYRDVMTELPSLQSTSRAFGISPGGIVVGGAEEPRDADARERAWVWNGTTAQLPDLKGFGSVAYGANLAGNVVGYSHVLANGGPHAVLWRVQ